MINEKFMKEAIKQAKIGASKYDEVPIGAVIVKDGKEGAGTSTPPGNDGGVVKTKEEIMKIKDTQERQKAWGEFIKNGGN